MAQEISNLIKFNTYKFERGGLLVDMFNQFNARVGDQGTELAIQWETSKTETKINLRERGLHFFGSGSVGQYLEKLEDGTGFKMSADASTVEWEDKDGAGSLDDGITVVKLPKQFFPQKGIFFGYFGLKDSLGNIFTSVNVWFRVLGGVPTMGAAIPYFVTEFDEVLERCNGKIVDALAELREKYQAEVKKNEDMSAETRAALEKLAASVGAIQAQIDAGNVITRAEYNDLAGRIDNRLATMDLKPESFVNLDAVKAAYPDGSPNLIVTDDGHRAVFRDGQWIDGGIFQTAGLSDNVQGKLNTMVPRNLIVNSAWSTNDISNWYAFGKATVTVNGDRGFNVLHMETSGNTDDQWSTITSEKITVKPGEAVSASVSALWKPADKNVDGAAMVINFYANEDGSGDRIAYQTVGFSPSAKFVLAKLENRIVPNNAKSARLAVQLKRNGSLDFYRPIFVADKLVKGYVPESVDTVHPTGRNLIADPTFNHESAFWNTDPTAGVSFGDYYKGYRAMTFETHGNPGEVWKAFFSEPVAVTPGEKISWRALLKWIADDTATDNAVITINFFDTSDASNRIDFKQYDLAGIAGDWREYGEDGILVPDSAVTANIMLQIKKNGLIGICMPLMIVGAKAGQYLLDNNFNDYENFISDTEFNEPAQWIHQSNQITSVEHGYQGHNVQKMEVHGSTSDVWYSDESRRFKVEGGSLIDAYLTINFQPDEEFTDNALFVINEYTSQDPNDGRINWYQKVIQGTNGVFAAFGQNGYKLQAQTQYVSVQIELQRNGKLEYAQPVIRYHKEPQQTSDNLVALNNVKFVDVDNATNLGLTYFPNYYHGHDAIRFTQSVGDNTSSSSATFNRVPLNDSRVASSLTYMKWLPSTANDFGLIVMDFLDENYQRVGYEMTHNKLNGVMEAIRLDNIAAPANAKYVDLHIELTGSGQLWVLQPKLVLAKQVAPTLDERVNQYDTKTDLPFISLVGNVDGMSKDQSKLMKFDYWNGTQHIEGYSETKWQGDSSLNFDKKNYRIKLFKNSNKKEKLKIKPKPTWQPESKFNLKANFADATMARNVINSRLAAEVTATRPGVPDEIIKAPNFAAVDGFPVHVYVNYFDCGIYTFNLTKDIFGNAAAGVTGDTYVPATLFNADSAKYDGSDFEFLTDDPTDADKESFNNVLKFVHTSSDDDFKAHLDEYMDVNSVIDYLIFQNIIANTDCWGKNAEYITYNGTKWYTLAYDLDIAYGSTWDGSSIDTNAINKNAGIFYSAAEGPNLLFKRVNELFSERVKARYQELRQWLTPNYVLTKYRTFMDSIGETNYKLDQDMWNTTSKDRYTFAQLQEYVYKRFQILDSIWGK
jgi:hypothetical protein